MTWYLDPDPAQRLDDVGATLVNRIAVTHILWDVFTRAEATSDALENLHKATELLRNTHHRVGGALAALTGFPRNTPAFAPAAVTLELEKLRAEIPSGDPDADLSEFDNKVSELLDIVSPATLADVNMNLLQVADAVMHSVSDTIKARNTTTFIIDASGTLVTAATHLAKAYRYAREDLPEVNKDRWLDDFSWSIAGQRKDRKELYLTNPAETSSAADSLDNAVPEPQANIFIRAWNAIISAFRHVIKLRGE
jgi:hypothetical protein